jgi:hypothetical protein
MAKKMVSVTMFEKPIEVDEDEIPGLRSQGLLIGVEGETAEHPNPAGDGTGDSGKTGDDAKTGGKRGSAAE